MCIAKKIKGKQEERASTRDKIHEMKERDDRMETDRERCDHNKKMTGSGKNDNKEGDLPHEYPLLSHHFVHLGSGQGFGENLFVRANKQIVHFNAF